jgi:hypothetical protein
MEEKIVIFYYYSGLSSVGMGKTMTVVSQDYSL